MTKPVKVKPATKQKIRVWLEDYMDQLEVNPKQDPYSFVSPRLGKKLAANYVASARHLDFYYKSDTTGKIVWRFTKSNENFMKYIHEIVVKTNLMARQRGEKLKKKREAQALKEAKSQFIKESNIKISNGDDDVLEKSKELIALFKDKDTDVENERSELSTTEVEQLDGLHGESPVVSSSEPQRGIVANNQNYENVSDNKVIKRYYLFGINIWTVREYTDNTYKTIYHD